MGGWLLLGISNGKAVRVGCFLGTGNARWAERVGVFRGMGILLRMMVLPASVACGSGYGDGFGNLPLPGHFAHCQAQALVGVEALLQFVLSADGIQAVAEAAGRSWLKQKGGFGGLFHRAADGGEADDRPACEQFGFAGPGIPLPLRPDGPVHGDCAPFDEDKCHLGNLPYWLGTVVQGTLEPDGQALGGNEVNGDPVGALIVAEVEGAMLEAVPFPGFGVVFDFGKGDGLAGDAALEGHVPARVDGVGSLAESEDAGRDGSVDGADVAEADVFGGVAFAAEVEVGEGWQRRLEREAVGGPVAGLAFGEPAQALGDMVVGIGPESVAGALVGDGGVNGARAFGCTAKVLGVLMGTLGLRILAPLFPVECCALTDDGLAVSLGEYDIAQGALDLEDGIGFCHAVSCWVKELLRDSEFRRNFWKREGRGCPFPRVAALENEPSN